MKTTKQWQANGMGWIHEDLIEAIQLDAMKEGARRAAKEAKLHEESAKCLRVQKTSSQAILTTAEQWTEKDL